MKRRYSRSGAILGAALAAAGLAASPTMADTVTLHGMSFGVVDFGDAVGFSLDGAGCEGQGVRVVAVTADATVVGPEAQPFVAPTGGCTGIARVPTWADLSSAGWQPGEAIDLQLVSGDQVVPLRYQRIDVNHLPVVAGAPAVQPGTDPDSTVADALLAMSTGDAVDLGRVNLEAIDAFSVRMCIVGVPGTGPDPFTSQAYDAPVTLGIYQDSVNGPALFPDADVSHNAVTYANLRTWGFGNTCWRTAHFPLSKPPVEAAPRLFLKIGTAAPGTLVVNSIDFDGTGARTDVPNWVAADPPGMETIFDGSSFDGWTQTGCELRDGAATTARPSTPTLPADCSMTHERLDTDQVIRLEVRRGRFYDNGGIYVPDEIQLRSVGEFGPGGYFLERAARWEKLNKWPMWSQMEIVQLGDHYVVRVNGRMVTDHYRAAGAPAPYPINLVTQPEFSDGVPSDNAPLDERGRVWFRNVRVYPCSSLDDPVCTSLANANAGQVPASAGDRDRDGAQDASDNCPFVANDQADSGAINTTTPDGIGDACQCGDVTGNGIVNGQDGNAIQRHGLRSEPNPLFANPGNCDVTGNDACNGQDANAVKREALGQASPLFGQNCHNALGTAVPPEF